MNHLTDSLWIAGGAAIGANARYWIGYAFKATTQPFPWPTLLVNVLGSCLLGAFSALALARGWGGQSRLFFAVGLCGGFTTFSTFAYEFITTGYERSWKVSVAYAALSLVLCIGACFLGGHLGRQAWPHSETNHTR